MRRKEGRKIGRHLPPSTAIATVYTVPIQYNTHVLHCAGQAIERPKKSLNHLWRQVFPLPPLSFPIFDQSTVQYSSRLWFLQRRRESNYNFEL